MEYTFTVDPDPDDGDFWSVFIDNGKGCSAEVAGKIANRALASLIRDKFNDMPQEAVCALWGIVQ